MRALEYNRAATERPENSKVRLASAEAISKRLVSVNDDALYQERIYPVLLQIAGQELPPLAVAAVVALAVSRVTRGDPNAPSSRLAEMFVTHLIDAMVENPVDRHSVMSVLNDTLTLAEGRDADDASDRSYMTPK